MFPCAQRYILPLAAAIILGSLPPAFAGDRAKAALEEVTKAKFVQMPLKDVVRYFCDKHTVKFTLADGVPVDVPISGVAEDVKLRVALDILLRPAGLSYSAGGDEIVILRAEKGK